MGNNQSNTVNTKNAIDDDDDDKRIECTRPSFLGGVVQNLFEPSQPPQQEEPIKLRPPKHMLWGCETPEEHYAKIKDVCTKAPLLEGKDGLRELGFEFVRIHAPETCTCKHAPGVWSLDDDDDDEQMN